METYTIKEVTTYLAERDPKYARCWISNWKDLIEYPSDDEENIESSKLRDLSDDQSMMPLSRMKRGDLVASEDERYRNDDVCIFDGEKISRLPHDLDEYGNLPNEFAINEFKGEYFNEIAHNSIRHLHVTKEIRQTMIKNMHTNSPFIYTSLKLLGETVVIVKYITENFSIVDFEALLHKDIIHLSMSDGGEFTGGHELSDLKFLQSLNIYNEDNVYFADRNYNMP